MVSTVTRTNNRASRTIDPGAVRSPKASSDVPAGTANFNRLALQLSLDPAVQAFEYLESLWTQDCSVRIEMLVARRGGRRVAFDIVDERPIRDLDAEGLLLIALQKHDIDLVEIDAAGINAGPTAENCIRIWNARYRVEEGVRARIEAALEENGTLSIGALGVLVRLPDPIPVVLALIRDGVLEVDLSIELDADSLVALSRGAASPPVAMQTPTPGYLK
jgi:hypothetical protein